MFEWFTTYGRGTLNKFLSPFRQKIPCEIRVKNEPSGFKSIYQRKYKILVVLKGLLLKPFMLNGLFYFTPLVRTISYIRSVWFLFIYYHHLLFAFNTGISINRVYRNSCIKCKQCRP